MKSLRPFLFSGVILISVVHGQPRREDIFTDVVLFNKRAQLEKDLRERVIAKTFSTPLDGNNEYKYETACDAIAQFQFLNSEIENGFSQIFRLYDSLEYDTRKSFLEAVYAVSPEKYESEMWAVLEKENSPALFAISASYLYRFDPSISNSNRLKIALVEKFPGFDSLAVLEDLVNFLSYHRQQVHKATPEIIQLFRYQHFKQQKTIYSFQRWNRDYPGLAIIQYADGHFARDAGGRLLVFSQLARSGSDLPYFLHNGSTPQGIYSIQGTGISHNNFIGPTPSIQLLLPFEEKWEKYFHTEASFHQDSLRAYLEQLPATWRHYEPMMESWNAGQAGRSWIIAHGTTIDPEYFKDKPFYPLTPTEGCLCAKEIWNNTTGHLLISEQFNLVSAFQATPGNKGVLFVVNIDNQGRPVSREEVESLVRQFEKNKSQKPQNSTGH
ncbi:MAG TPA: hypothetical protein VKR32_09885 [Puia sp.]|nr:hypothetical protein [Puia sp.]